MILSLPLFSLCNLQPEPSLSRRTNTIDVRARTEQTIDGQREGADQHRLNLEFTRDSRDAFSQLDGRGIRVHVHVRVA